MGRTWAMRGEQVPWVTAAVAFAVYVSTLAPTVHYGDSPELAMAALDLGVPHPTGYPLYTLAGFAWSKLFPFGDAAWRLNLLSALFAAAAVGFLAASGGRLAGHALAGWTAGLLFAFAPSFWAQATVNEVYTLHILIAAIALWALVRHVGAPARCWPRAAALVLGLGLAHHGMTALLVPTLALGLAWDPVGRPGRREWLVLGLLLAAPLALYAYLPLAASREPVIAWGMPTTWPAFVAHVTGAQYHGFVQPPDARAVAAGLVTHLRSLGEQLGHAYLPIALLGLWLLRGRPALLATTLTAYAAAVGAALAYGIVDIEPYHLPAFAIFALWIATGIGFLLRGLATHPGTLGRVGPAVIALAPALSLVGHHARLDRTLDYEPHDRACAALAALPSGAALLTQGPTGYPPVYASSIELLRPDVDVIDMFLRIRPRYPREVERLRWQPLREPWTRDLAVAHAVVDARGSAWLWPDVPDLDWKSAGLIRVRRGIVDQLLAEPPDLHSTARAPLAAGIRFGGEVEFLGADIQPDVVAPGGSVRVRYFWRRLGTGASEGVDVVGALAGETGDLLTRSDGGPAMSAVHPLGQGVPLELLGPGEPFVETLDLLVPRAVPTGQHALWVAVKRGEEFVATPGESAFVRGAALAVRGEPAPLWTAGARERSSARLR